MKKKIISFCIAFLINGLLFGVLRYLMNSFTSYFDDDITLKGLIFSASFFGFFMAIFQTLIMPSFNKNKIDKQ
ncbi:hypothetical protein [Flavobacterium limnosediminis]|uniref:hypothetical protein n=1 Tax=Flavobacterium limnosediminis TaxID=1401027 RepID=UPI00042002BA|nr:hypothetical protein [Flavobacterium limnosediminis]